MSAICNMHALEPVFSKYVWVSAMEERGKFSFEKYYLNKQLCVRPPAQLRIRQMPFALPVFSRVGGACKPGKAAHLGEGKH